MLQTDSPQVQQFLAAWHENGRARWAREYVNLNYDQDQEKTAHERRKYIALDRGGKVTRSGVYLLDKATGEVYSIKGYGAPNRRLGTLAELTQRLHDATTAGQEIRL